MKKRCKNQLSYICGCTKSTTERTTQQKTQRIQKSWEPVHNTHKPTTRATKNCLTITQPNQKHGTITKTITPKTPLKKSHWWLILVELDCIEVEVIDSWLQLKSVSSLDKIDDTEKSNQIKLKITWSFLVRFKNRTESKKVEFDWLGFLFSILKSNCTEETKLTKLTFSLGPYPTLAPKQQTTSVQIYQD